MPFTPVDLLPLSTNYKVSFEDEQRTMEIKKLHKQIGAHIKKISEASQAKANKNKRGVEYQPGDFVWLHLKKEGFLIERKSKLMARGDGPFKVRAKAGANAYKLQLHRDTAVSSTFNVGDVSPYMEDEVD